MSEEELKTLNVKINRWQELQKIRIEKKMKTMDDVIEFLLKK